MLLRDHPLMSRNGVSNWPPTWTWIRGARDKYPKGEVGVLKGVLPSKIRPEDRCFYLFLSRSRVSRLSAIRLPYLLQAHNWRSSVLLQSSYYGRWQPRPLLHVVKVYVLKAEMKETCHENHPDHRGGMKAAMLQEGCVKTSPCDEDTGSMFESACDCSTE